MIAGSPVVQVTWFTILLGVLAPIVWPMTSAPAKAPQVQVRSDSESNALAI